MRKPFIKFICHSASYFSFLCKYWPEILPHSAVVSWKTSVNSSNFESFEQSSSSTGRNSAIFCRFRKQRVVIVDIVLIALLGSASFWPTLLCLILRPLTAFRSRLLSNALATMVDHTIDDAVDFDRKRRLLETTTTGCHRLLCQMSRFCCLFPLALPLSQTVSLFFLPFKFY